MLQKVYIEQIVVHFLKYVLENNYVYTLTIIEAEWEQYFNGS